jgi:diguanylate cyclase (GGDEF)-like protein/PAS domain S-box-containing protein
MQEPASNLRQRFESWRQSSRRRFGLRLLLALVLLNLGVVSVTVWALLQSRENYLATAEVESRNYVQLIEQDIGTLVHSLDRLLQSMVVQYPQLLARSNAQAEQLVAMQASQYPDVENLVALDASGRVLHASLGVPPGTPSLAGRDYFRALRARPDAGLLISRPFQGQISKKWVIVLARAMRDARGQFAGVVLVSIPLARLSQAFLALEFSQRGAYNLFDNEFHVITRYPELNADGLSSIGRPFNSTALQGRMADGLDRGTYRASSSIDKIDRVYSYNRIRAYGLNVIVGVNVDDYLEGWRAHAWALTSLVAFFMFITSLFAWSLHRAWCRQELNLQRLSELNQQLDHETALNQTIIRSSPFAIYTRDRDGIVTAWNPAAEQLFGWRAEDVVGRPLPSVPAGKQRETSDLRDRVLGGESILGLEVQRQKADGTLFDLSTTLAPLREASGEIKGYLAIAADITARKLAERQVEFLAYRDVLTGLPNRLLLQDRFGQAVAHAERMHSRLALLFLDLDNFKTINDSLGHAVGDALLKDIALRLGECVRETDTISRQGGDEFLIVLSDLAGTEAIVPVLLKIRERLQLPFVIDGHELSTSASIGVALYPDDGRDFETLHQKADTAMYRAKDAGRNHYRFFDEQMNIEAVEHLHLKNGLRRALERGEFELHYQPQIALPSGRVVGVEALLRWRHPEQGLIPPARFIPVAEDGGLIVPIGEWVLQEACRQAMAWRAQGLPPLVMAVNLSAVQFRRGELQPSITRILQRTGFDPRMLELELTESIMIHDAEAVLASVRQLKQLGIRLSIDDFGTGYSSLSYLKRFDVDKLKIDQGFVRDLARNPDDAAIVRAIIQMAASLGLQTIAEGVEDAGALALLRQFGCHEAQGYYFARPMEAQALADYVRHMVQTPPNFENTGAL